MRIEWTDTLQTIFAAVIYGGMDLNSPDLQIKRDTHKQCLPLFRGKFIFNIFEDEYAIFYEVLNNFKVGVFTETSLESVLDNNKDIILNSSQVDFDSILSTIDGLKEKAAEIDKYVVFKGLIIERFKQLSNIVVSLEEFKSACEVYKMLYKKEKMTEIINNMSIINQSGKTIRDMQGRAKRYDGVDGADKYYDEAMKVIESLDETDRKQSIVVDADWLAEDLEDEKSDDKLKLFSFGLPEIDNCIKYFRRTQILGVLGPPKGGKTKTARWLTAKALSEGLNVCVWPIEGHYSEWINDIVANLVKIDSGISITGDSILTKTYDKQFKQYVIHAKTKLAMAIDRGKLSFMDGACYLEDFLDDLMQHYENENAFDVLVLDSLTLVQSRRGINKVERISTAYENIKIFLSSMLPTPAFGILTAQLKQEVVNDMRGNPDAEMDVTSGGEAAATIRTPDYVIGVFSSKEERNAGLQKIYSVASRHNASFNNFTCRLDYGCCYYESDENLNG